MRKAMTSMSTIKIEHPKDAHKCCGQESKKRGINGFGYAPESCAFWGKRLMHDVAISMFQEKLA
jgi:hypothetical protein